MKIAITGGTGFVGRHITRALLESGHDVVLVARGQDHTDPSIRHVPGASFVPVSLDEPVALTKAFAGCKAVVHCAGINREIGGATYQRVHTEGTRHVVEAARRNDARKIVLLSFLRARPNCGSGYHESKYAAEEIVRQSGLDYTVLRCGVIYGRGDHMLTHLSQGFHTFPVFAFVGFQDKPVRPTAVEDVARLATACVLQNALARKTVAVVGPEELGLREAVCRVAGVVGRKPLMFPMPLWFHYVLGWCLERLMTVPMVAVAQVRILSEGVAEPALACDPLPAELTPQLPFSEEQIRRGLPPPRRFGLRDLRCCRSVEPRRTSHRTTTFFEMP